MRDVREFNMAIFDVKRKFSLLRSVLRSHLLTVSQMIPQAAQLRSAQSMADSVMSLGGRWPTTRNISYGSPSP